MEPSFEKAAQYAIELAKPKFMDARALTERERQQLNRLVYMAFCDLRILARGACNEQAHALADAFHNVPLLMHRDDFSFRAFRDSLSHYQEDFSSQLLTNYLEELNKITAHQDQK